jgi:hypothetical protein
VKVGSTSIRDPLCSFINLTLKLLSSTSMNEEHPALTSKQPNDSCRLCGKREGLVSSELCRRCLKKTLLKQLPWLKRALEMSHGVWVDSWLAEGKLIQSSWQVADDLQVNMDLVKSLLRNIIKEAVAREEIALYLPKAGTWKPIEVGSLITHVYEQCVYRLRPFIIGLLVEAVRSAPTEESERELVNIVSGRKRVRHRYVRERAVEALTLSETTPFTLPAMALIEIRYQADKGRDIYTELSDDKISSVWEEIRESLPEEVAKLISTEGMF